MCAVCCPHLMGPMWKRSGSVYGESTEQGLGVCPWLLCHPGSFSSHLCALGPFPQKQEC